MTSRVPLTPAGSPAAASITICCYACHRRARYDVAARDGWTYDPAGPAFVAYYCPAEPAADLTPGEGRP
jgi:hypothetical protein